MYSLNNDLNNLENNLINLNKNSQNNFVEKVDYQLNDNLINILY